MSARQTTRRRRRSANAEPTYSDLLATVVRPSRMIDSLGKSLTKLIASNDAIIDLWSFESEPHDLPVGARVLLRKKTMPDGKVFYNLQ